MKELHGCELLEVIVFRLDKIQIKIKNILLSVQHCIVIANITEQEGGNDKIFFYELLIPKRCNFFLQMYADMIYKFGYVHCDPHAGNILVRKNEHREDEIVLLDHGLYTVILKVVARNKMPSLSIDLWYISHCTVITLEADLDHLVPFPLFRQVSSFAAIDESLSGQLFQIHAKYRQCRRGRDEGQRRKT